MTPPLWTWLPIFLGALNGAPLVFPRLRKSWFISSAAILTIDWNAGRVPIAWPTDIPDWATNSIIDLSAMWLFIVVAWRLQSGLFPLAMLGASFFFEVTIHIADGIFTLVHADKGWAPVAYYWATFIVAWCQALFLLYRGVSNGGRRERSDIRRNHPLIHNLTHNRH